MIDFSAYIHSDWSWIVLFVMAVFVGMSKINLTTLAIDACAIPFVLIGAFLGIRIVKFLPESFLLQRVH